jgi:MATE family, multidrug efflux pump
MQPANGAVFALDGILIGAGDTRFLMWGMLAASLLVFVPVALISLQLDWGIVGVWSGLLGLIGVRLGTCLWRFRGRRWAIVGATRAPAG